MNHQEVTTLVKQALDAGEYEAADQFLTKMLYESAPEVRKDLLCEENMVLKLLTEALLCEKRRNEGADSWRDFHQDYREFFSRYQRLKRGVRRIWFGLDEAHQKELNVLLEREPVSPDLLAIVAKYAVPTGYWGDLYAKLEAVAENQRVRTVLSEYRRMIGQNHLSGTMRCATPRERKGQLSYRRLSYQKEESPVQAGLTDGMKLAIIYCTNDEGYAAECRQYLSYLTLPEGMTGEILELWNASSMAAGYNFAMRSTDAKYKIYIHHDTMLIRTDLLHEIVKAFRENPGYGMLGLFGTTELPKSGRWAEAPYEKSVLTLWQDAILDFIPPKKEKKQELRAAGAIDGAFLATAVDLSWREDLFDHWHFYDISQCLEMKRNGHEIGLLAGADAYLLHESTLRKDPTDAYGKYCNIFLAHYGKDLQ